MRILINHTAKILGLVLLLTIALHSQDAGKDSVFVMHKSPWGAVVRSAIIPGWGQIYNESYLKAPVIWGISAWLVFNWVQNNNQYKSYQKAAINYPIYIQQRDFYRDQRDLFAIYMGLTYLLNLVDAYVDAHLFDFNVDDTGPSKIVTMRFKLSF